MKKIFILFALLIIFINKADANPGLTVQVNTYLNAVSIKPSWLLIVRDLDSQQVTPFLFDFNQKNNFWLEFIPSHTYKITVSQLKFNAPIVINNFCHLENKIVKGEAYIITLTGKLSPDMSKLNCQVVKYQVE